ncbi:hypothetical protein C1645_813648, partial [Glomus cerebriforme]
MCSQNFYVKVFALFIIILCIYPLCTTAELSYIEKEDYGPTVITRMWDSKSYEDGTMVIRIVRKNAIKSMPDRSCFYEILSLRLIYTNGTVIEKDIKLDIQSFNYCIFSNDGIIEEYLKYYLIRKNQILVTYYNATEPNDVYSYEQWGMMINFDGKVLDRTSFGFAFIDNTTQEIIPKAQIQTNINKDKGFLRINLMRNTADLEWQQYRIESAKGTFTKLSSGTLPFPYHSIHLMSTVDEGYAVVFVNTTNTYNATNPLLPQSQMFAIFIGYNQNYSATFLLYQTQLPNLTFMSLFCDIDHVGVGHSCLLSIKSMDNVFYIKINFLSSGSVVSINNMDFHDIPKLPNDAIWKIKILRFGGYLFTLNTLTNVTKISISNVISAYLFAENGTNFLGEEPLQTNVRSVSEILPNNTFLIARNDTVNSWGFNAINLPKFTDKDQGYFNTNIESTFPKIDDSLIYSDIANISIDFYDQVDLSDGSLSIYYQMGDQKNLRQLTSGNSSQCTLDNDDKRVIVKIFNCTFSNSGGDYFIKIDPNFVKNRVYKEPLIGIGENVWKFTIKDEKVPYNFTRSTFGLLRLTMEGTKEFENSLNDKQFYNPLLDQLANAVLITRDRLVKNKYQIDPNSNERQLLISIKIEETKDQYEKDVDSIVNDINNSILFKEQTPIGQSNVTRNLDSTFGFKPAPDYWKEYKFKLLGLLLVIIFLIILFGLAHMKNKKGRNIAIFQLALFIFDFVLDTLFISKNANDIPKLYIPSLIFYTLPIGLNTISAFLIITKENTKPKFNQWFTENIKFTSIFTILAGADVEILNILQSNLA